MPHQCTNCGKTFADGSKEMLSGCPDCGGNKFQFRPSGATDAESDGTGSDSTPDRDQSTSSGRPNTDRSDRSGVTGTAAKAGASVREWVGNRTTDETNEPDETGKADGTDDAPEATTASTDVTIEPTDDGESDGTTATDEPGDASASESTTPESPSPDREVDSAEDRAQASARSDVVTPEELSAAENRPVGEQPADADGTVIEPESEDRPDLSDLRDELNDQFESIKILQPGQYELNLMELYDREEYIISLREDGRYVIEVPDTWRGSEDED
ncbi:hypothetical protein SAMN04487948_103444 [Halogranum amylolyticum]|uniref:Zn-ribbon containing protein n=1 Tax=Halogranum amylolyticum TaxID=660520 RepID=A0A1H8R1J7_9EURY|nr:Zn-ribbon containing protein [Halogranum amylolyticum]SEO60355.1 hypothetical protein SAMN04487948_103444 [Halogranum amylolyticum]